MNSQSGRFKKKILTELPYVRELVSLANYADEHIFVCGGIAWHETINHVDRYDIARNVLERAPSLNEVRRYHSSCTLGHCIYVFFGVTSYERESKSIEKLDV